MTVAPRWRLAAVAVTLAVVLVGCGEDDGEDVATSTSPTAGTGPSTTVAPAAPSGGTEAVLAVTVRGGSVEGSTRRRVTLNQPVRITVTSDIADEVHVHGYDKTVDVKAGQPAELSFVANIPGVFEVELERSRRTLFTLEVQP